MATIEIDEQEYRDLRTAFNVLVETAEYASWRVSDGCPADGLIAQLDDVTHNVNADQSAALERLVSQTGRQPGVSDHPADRAAFS